MRARAHHLQPVVIVGQHGLTPPVLREVDLALKKHELVKVRVFSDERVERMALLDKVCAAMDCAAVQHLGKVLVLWRPSPEAAKPPAADEGEGAWTRKEDGRPAIHGSEDRPAIAARSSTRAAAWDARGSGNRWQGHARRGALRCARRCDG